LALLMLRPLAMALARRVLGPNLWIRGSREGLYSRFVRLGKEIGYTEKQCAGSDGYNKLNSHPDSLYRWLLVSIAH
jgi:hypothetical protein